MDTTDKRRSSSVVRCLAPVARSPETCRHSSRVGTTISAGTLQIAGSGYLGGGNYTGNVSIASGALLNYNSAAAQTFPDHLVEILVPSTPGASADILGRVLAEGMAAKLNARFIVQNKPGGSGIIGTVQNSGVACGPADGYIHPAYPSNGSITAEQSRLVIRPYSRALPAAGVTTLGVCLGHQSMAEAFGGRVLLHPPVHGKATAIEHDGRTIFEGMSSPLTVGRYHSLIVEKKSLPDALEISAETSDGIIMGLRHRKLKVEGVQFHPESVLTGSGFRLLENFLTV